MSNPEFIPFARSIAVLLVGAGGLLALAGCAGSGSGNGPADSATPAAAAGAAGESDASRAGDSAPPPAIARWMERLTIPHRYDPETGFIVALEPTPLPPLFTDGPSLDDAIERAGDGRVVIAFATADRCAPCQQFKLDALNDPRVLARLGSEGVLTSHVEVDREPEVARRWLGGPAIPMSYALVDGKVVATLRGQQSADALLAWLDEQLPASS